MGSIEEGRAAKKNLIKYLAIFFLCPSKQFLPISFQIQLAEYFPQKQKEKRHKQLSWLPHKIRSLKILVHPVTLIVRLITFRHRRDWIRNSRNVQLGPGQQRRKLGLVWRNRKKISQIINDFFCLPFFLFIILWLGGTKRSYKSILRFPEVNKENKEIFIIDREKKSIWPTFTWSCFLASWLKFLASFTSFSLVFCPCFRHRYRYIENQLAIQRYRY